MKQWWYFHIRCGHVIGAGVCDKSMFIITSLPFAYRLAILHDTGLTKENKLVEVQRDDLVGAHVGSTEAKTNKKISQARGVFSSLTRHTNWTMMAQRWTSDTKQLCANEASQPGRDCQEREESLYSHWIRERDVQIYGNEQRFVPSFLWASPISRLFSEWDRRYYGKPCQKARIPVWRRATHVSRCFCSFSCRIQGSL